MADINITSTQFYFQSSQDAIIATLAYFALFQYPLTLFEIWQYLLCSPTPCTIADIDNIISTSLCVKSKIEQHNGLFFVPGRRNDGTLRLDRYRDAEAQYLSTIRDIRLLSCIPFVELICIVNRLSYSNARDDGDSDLLIVAKHHHIWLVRFLCASLMHILGKRPGQRTKKNAICLSFFISDKNLSMESLQIPRDNRGMPDVHFAVWLTQIVPIYDRGGIYQEWYQQNSWVEQCVPNRIPIRTHERRRVGLTFSQKCLKVAGELFIKCFGSIGESFVKWYQITFLAPALKHADSNTTCVVMNDMVLKFHVNDRRHEFREKFKSMLQTLHVNLHTEKEV